MARPTGVDDGVLLDRAMHAFWAQGYDATSIRDLEQALELRAPAIYHRFESKETLFLRSLDHYVESVVEARLAGCLGTSDDAIADLQRFFLAAASASEHGRPGWGCLLTNSATEIGATSEPVRARVQGGLERIRRAFERELTRAAGGRRQGSSPEELSHLLLLAFEGLDVLARLGTGEDELRRRVNTIFTRLFPTHERRS